MKTKIEFSKDDFSESFEKHSFKLAHNLHEHPLFTIEGLIDAANRLRQEDIEYNAGDVDIVAPNDKKPDHRFTPEETIHRIKNLNTWLGLKKIQQLPEYRQLIDEILDTLKPHIDPHCPGMRERQGFIFITSPNSTVPYHMDPEHNFLFQIKGDKYFTIFDKHDRKLLSEEEIEHHYGQTNRKMLLPGSYEDRGTTICLKPGDAMHVPINAPHYVKNSDDVSISISITYTTPSSLRRETVYRMNRKIRKLGVVPKPFEQSGFSDQMKLSMYRCYHLLRHGKRASI